MTLGEASIFLALVGSIVAFLYKAIVENSNATNFTRILDQLTLNDTVHTSSIKALKDDHDLTKKKVNLHEEELTKLRKDLRDGVA